MWIKEKKQEFCSSQKGEQLALKEDTDTFKASAAEERDHIEPEPDREQLLFNDTPKPESRDRGGSKYKDMG